jgi:hypothetical protein
MTTFCSFLGDTTFTGFADRALQTNGRAHLPAGFTGRRSTAWDFALSRIAASGGAGAPRTEEVLDLVHVLESRGLTGEALLDVARFASAVSAAVRQPGIGRCVVDDEGRFAVAVYRVEGSNELEVRPGDVMFAGVQLSGEVATGRLLVEPHVLRRLCSNGTVVRGPADATPYARTSEAGSEGDLEHVVATALGGRPAKEFVADLRKAAATPQPRPTDLLARGLLRLDGSQIGEVLRHLRPEEPTLFGLVNAITKVARDSVSLPTSLALEREAGRLVASLMRRGSPGRATGVGPLPT